LVSCRSDIEKDMREFNEHLSRFPSVKLPKSGAARVNPDEPEDVKQLAELLEANPGFSGSEIDGLLKYYKDVVSGKVTPDQPLEEQFPELKYKHVAPWTLKHSINNPGEELAARVAEDGKYLDVPSDLRKALESQIASGSDSDSDDEGKQ
jgi:hypothetical protein